MTSTELSALMAARGWTDAALAAALGVARETVFRWRKGNRPISTTTAIAIKSL